MLYDAINKINKKEYKESEKILKKIIINNSKNSRAHYLLGIVYLKLNKIDKSYVSLKKSLLLNESIEYLFAYAEVSLKKNFLLEAESSYKKILKKDPNNEHTIINIAYLYLMKNQYEESEHYYLKAIKLKPKNPDYYNSLGNLYKKQNKIKEAMNNYEKGIKLNSNIPEIKKGKGLILLSQKKYEEAWEYFENRIFSGQNKGLLFSTIKNNLFLGNKIDNSKKLVIVSEQGIGDKILFSSFYPDLLKLKIDTKFLIDSRLEKIFKRSFGNYEYININNIEKIKELVKENHQFIYAGSLGKFFRNKIIKFNGNAFLKPDKEKVLRYKSILKGYNYEKYIGISWKSSSKFSDKKSFYIDDFDSIIKEKDYGIINLQYGDLKDLNEYNLKSEKKIIQINDLDLFNDIDSTIALIYCLDFVVTSPNLTIHLAGSVGKKCLAFYHQEYESILNSETTKNEWYKNLKITQFTNNLKAKVEENKFFFK